jgi:hypothetical protein
MKVFISHKREDFAIALAIQKEFTRYGVLSYLDILDNSITGGGKELTDHIKDSLNSCTDIIVVMSEATKESWWVPFEVGMSAQVDMPTVSFLSSEVALPSYLSYWPRLKNVSDISKYIAVRRRTERTINEQYFYYSSAAKKTIETRKFYEELKYELR